jgi:hypothetical protein
MYLTEEQTAFSKAALVRKVARAASEAATTEVSSASILIQRLPTSPA